MLSTSWSASLAQRLREWIVAEVGAHRKRAPQVALTAYPRAIGNPQPCPALLARDRGVIHPD